MEIKERNMLGIDYGDNHVGFAFKSAGTMSALPLSVFERYNDDRESLINKLKDMKQELEIDEFVVGLPLTLEGKPGKMADKVALFIHDITKEIGIPVYEEDERMTTRIVGKSAHDKAAAIILQSFIDRSIA